MSAAPPAGGPVELEVVVYGLPQPQGSAKAYLTRGPRPRPVVTTDNDNLYPWRQAVAAAVRRQSGGLKLTGAVTGVLVFTLPRPVSAPRSRLYPVVRPDLDKLMRAALDSVTDAGVWRDDCQLVAATLAKTYPGVHPGSLARPGLVLRLRELAL